MHSFFGGENGCAVCGVCVCLVCAGMSICEWCADVECYHGPGMEGLSTAQRGGVWLGLARCRPAQCGTSRGCTQLGSGQGAGQPRSLLLLHSLLWPQSRHSARDHLYISLALYITQMFSPYWYEWINVAKALYWMGIKWIITYCLDVVFIFWCV